MKIENHENVSYDNGQTISSKSKRESGKRYNRDGGERENVAVLSSPKSPMIERLRSEEGDSDDNAAHHDGSNDSVNRDDSMLEGSHYDHGLNSNQNFLHDPLALESEDPLALDNLYLQEYCDALDEELMYCDDCAREWRGDCPIHGPMIIIEDTPAPLDIVDLFRARRTAPYEVSIGESLLPELGIGVWARVSIPARTRFGPYEGQVRSRNACSAEYSWQICIIDMMEYYIDASEPGLSNWMRYVKFARSKGEQNLEVFELGGNIYYRTIRNVAPDEELLVWYSEDDQIMHIEPEIDNYDEEFVEEEENKGDGEEIEDGNSEGEADLMETVRTFEQSASSDGQNDESIKTPLQCPKCQRQFTFKRSLEKHKTACRLTCSTCKQIFSTKKIYREHVDTYDHSVRDNYSCPTCGKGFELKALYTIHLREHKGSYVCPSEECGRIFDKEGHLERHIGSLHGNEMPFVCDLCKERFPTNFDLKKHENLHAGFKRFICKLCYENFSFKVNWEKHVKRHRFRDKYRCLYCKECFGKAEDLKSHVESHLDMKIACPICNRKFPRPESLGGHLKVHCSEEERKLVRRYRRSESRTYMRKRYMLLKERQQKLQLRQTQRQKEQQMKEQLQQEQVQKQKEVRQQKLQLRQTQRHKEQQMKEEQEQVQKQKEVRQQKLQLRQTQRHKEQQMKEEQEQVQKQKEVRQQKQQQLKEQLQQEQQQEQKELQQQTQQQQLQPEDWEEQQQAKFCCDICEKDFSFEENLKRHLTLHDDKRTYECSHCNERFKGAYNLSVHLKANRVAKPYVCFTCNQRFKFESQFFDHSGSHPTAKPFVCPVCNESFHRRYTLQRHQAVHAEDDSLNCNLCGEEFSDKDTFAAHIRQHTGEKAFGCEVCNKRFASFQELLDHLPRHF